MTTKIGRGTTFHSVYADSNPKWRITRSRGRGVWEAVVVESEDWKGTVKVFLHEDVARAVAMAAFFEQTQSEHERFYAELKLGATVHYHNGGGEWVRCVAVDGVTEWNDKVVHRCLQPVALVGAWRESDLRPGGFYARRLGTVSPIEPNYLNLFEAGKTPPRAGDPRELPALGLAFGMVASS